MCIPPLDEAPAPHFALTAKIAARNGLKLLSMGMSADFATAIAFGATHVRVGTAIFGAQSRVLKIHRDASIRVVRPEPRQQPPQRRDARERDAAGGRREARRARHG